MRLPVSDGALHDAPRSFTELGHHAQHRLSRRAFMGGAAGLTAATVGAGLLRPHGLVAAPPSNPAPKPTSNVISLGGLDFHLTFFGPGMDPASITDFNGFVGVAEVQGTGTATNPDGSTETLLFDTDMRFMSGEYIGQDGRNHHGAFAFVWLDLYRGRYDFDKFSTQVHDFDPGITPYPSGLFWTVPLGTGDALAVQFEAGKAQLSMANLSLQDFSNIPNALFRFENPVSVPATCSFDIRWSGPVTSRGPVTSPSGSTGELVMSQATMSWSASNASGFRFQSNSVGTSSVFAQLGHVQNGVFAAG